MHDEYVDNGGDQTTFMTEVLMPLFEVSGFTPLRKQEQENLKKK